MTQPSDGFEQIIRSLAARIHAVEIRETSPPPSCLVADLPAASVDKRGRLRFVVDGRKIGEVSGAGTGVLAYDDGGAWRRTGDDTTVTS